MPTSLSTPTLCGAQLIYSGPLGLESSALIAYLEAVPGVHPISAGKDFFLQHSAQLPPTRGFVVQPSLHQCTQKLFVCRKGPFNLIETEPPNFTTLGEVFEGKSLPSAQARTRPHGCWRSPAARPSPASPRLPLLTSPNTTRCAPLPLPRSASVARAPMTCPRPRSACRLKLPAFS